LSSKVVNQRASIRNLLKNTSYVPQGEISFEGIAGQARNDKVTGGRRRELAA